jgi:glutamine synthetase
MHTHVSLFKGEENAFFDQSAELNLSKVGRSFIAGLLKHAPEITLITNQWVNSYKRLHGGDEAPAVANWGQSARGSLVRVPMYKPKKENSTRIEFRSPDSACNPYLAYAVMLAAGLKGVEEGYVLAPADSADVRPLPSNLNEKENSLSLIFEPSPCIKKFFNLLSRSILIESSAKLFQFSSCCHSLSERLSNKSRL